MRSQEHVSGILRLLSGYQRAGYELFPLQGKLPIHKGWQTRDYSAFDFPYWLAMDGNVGFRLRPSDLIIDCDPRNYQPGDNPLRRLSEAVFCDLEDAPTTRTGSGGLHLFYRKPSKLRIVGKLHGYDGLDLLSAGKLIVAPGSIHPSTGNEYRAEGVSIATVEEAPGRLLDALRRPDAPSRTGAGGELTPEQLALLLSALDATKYGCGDYAAWIRISAACHDATNGEGFGEWLDWCCTDPDYENTPDMDRNNEVWDGFKAGKSGGATYRTLFKAVRDAGRGDLVQQIHFDQGLNELTPQELDFDDLPKPQELDFDHD